MSDTRNSILARLRASRDAHPLPPPASDFTPIEAKHWPNEERLPRIRRLMEAVHTEFLDATEVNWPAVLRDRWSTHRRRTPGNGWPRGGTRPPPPSSPTTARSKTSSPGCSNPSKPA